MNLQSAIEEFLIDQQVRGNSSKTLKYYRQTMGVFREFAGDIALVEITLLLCKRYYIHLSQRKIASTTMQSYVKALRAFLSWCFSEGYIVENIPSRLKLPKAQRKVIDVLTDDEIRRLFACFNLRDWYGIRNYAMCALMLDSGLRLNEVVSLEWGGVHVPEGYAIVNGKGNKQRIVPLGLQSKKVLIRYLGALSMKHTIEDEKAALFVKDEQTPIKQSTVESLFRKLKRKAGIPRLRPHLLRHSFATRYLENGGDVYSLQQILGHTSLDMVRRYVHQTPSKTIACFPQFSPLG
ncbi:MAG: tyrosine-type recombinase/integrase [Oscillospiraceae bacterium]|jgi:integrase/recombinase XerC/integrase/recombinase XerD|nr:tyrosine-type recombinase/integrase [Oscillospiraceae bacterium]